MEKLDESVPVDLAKRRAHKGSVLTYYLCVYPDVDGVRAELSCPVNVENGFFEKFFERVFIAGGDTGVPEPIRRKSDDDDDGSEYEIPVKRKK
ncbi:MAG: hypothetical protein CVT72_02495 [Alphaproteobacteria bacterium HGW-Alphaproteobacteria-11]|nr:MAG: hypothetical protein CVT72_02495 [Alphaproteobacteria bacterium HGW-Alphaproteobacteria-11]